MTYANSNATTTAPRSSLKAQTPEQLDFNRLSASMAAKKQKQELPLKEKEKTVRASGTGSVGSNQYCPL